MEANIQDDYPDPIDERLFPYYQELAEAVSLFAEASIDSRPFYTKMVLKSHDNLIVAKDLVNRLKDERKN
jgi:hypothetical protein